MVREKLSLPHCLGHCVVKVIDVSLDNYGFFHKFEKKIMICLSYLLENLEIYLQWEKKLDTIISWPMISWDDDKAAKICKLTLVTSSVLLL